ncbi:MAG: hypothetical protein JOY63_03925 [Acetobacteraceae bacterium]|nr:hypothetical protein [Acetobacteraceae bacterium]
MGEIDNGDCVGRRTRGGDLVGLSVEDGVGVVGHDRDLGVRHAGQQS